MNRRRFHMVMIAACTIFVGGLDGSRAYAADCKFEIQGEGRVSAVLDSRTFRLDDGREVRLAGIVAADQLDRQIDGRAALVRLIEGRHVVLRGASDAPDRYGRQIALAFPDGGDTSLQSRLLSDGEALISATPAEADCSRDWSAAEAAARRAKKGLWGNAVAIKNAENTGDILARTGRFTIIEGKVLSTRALGAIFYINFGRRWTRDFAVTISRRMMPAFETAGISLTSLENRRVRVRGWVEQRGGPRIEASRTGQLELIDDKVVKNDSGG